MEQSSKLIHSYIPMLTHVRSRRLTLAMHPSSLTLAPASRNLITTKYTLNKMAAWKAADSCR